MHYNSRYLTSSSGIQYRTSAHFVTADLPFIGEFKGLANSLPPLVVHSAVVVTQCISLLQLGGAFPWFYITVNPLTTRTRRAHEQGIPGPNTGIKQGLCCFLMLPIAFHGFHSFPSFVKLYYQLNQYIQQYNVVKFLIT